MSRFQPHVCRDRDTSKGKSDFANVLTEGWANIFEPFVPVVCTVTSSGGGRGMSRRHFAATFFPFSLSLFFSPDRKTTENNAFEKRCARWLCVGMRERRLKNVRCRRWKTRGMKLLFHLISGEMAILIAPRSDELKNSVSKIHYSSTSGWPVEKKERGKKKKKDETASGKILSKSMESWGMKSVWRFDYETSEMNNLMNNETKKKTVKARLVWLVKNWRIEKRLKTK